MRSSISEDMYSPFFHLLIWVGDTFSCSARSFWLQPNVLRANSIASIASWFTLLMGAPYDLGNYHSSLLNKPLIYNLQVEFRIRLKPEKASPGGDSISI